MSNHVATIMTDDEPASKGEFKTAANLVNDYQKAVRLKNRLGLMRSMADPDSGSVYLRMKFEEAKDREGEARRVLIDAIINGLHEHP